MKTKIFIDGSEGTTGLRIFERFENREDIELLKISSQLRKDVNERKRLINESDITFLCLPDAAAIESVGLVENENVRIIDTSTAHRTLEGWAYGFPELSEKHYNDIKTGKRVAVPGCHATGFIAAVYPLIDNGVMGSDYPVSAFSLTGYSGGGKKMIAEYELERENILLNAPREYALTQKHKHLREMKAITGLSREPLFSPIVADYYSGMIVSVPVYLDMLKSHNSIEELHTLFEKHYEGKEFVTVMPFGAEEEQQNMLSGNACSMYDGMRIYITGNDERAVISAQFDNLGKGASGAAIECMNIMLGCDAKKGLSL
ncbi:MAG: N-acetyl-gamma-glutamyl-phosphate reductase [Lachnospiraceae bacterium]|nr:N-acetyl-gamma-glutamyl-phosphate reductase [Lachnospiraceae bacterium]MDE6698653.1 N-acetyl-gamma-glutamyl-phosphate reductase [Lachnospiraceae bacterium]